MVDLHGYELRPLKEGDLVFGPLGDLDNISCKRLYRAWTKQKEEMAEYEAENLLSKYRNENIVRLRRRLPPVIFTMQGPVELVVPKVNNYFEKLWKCPKHRCAKAHRLASRYNTRANLNSMRDVVMASATTTSSTPTPTPTPTPTTSTSSTASESKRSSSDKDNAATIVRRQGFVEHAKAGKQKA